MKKSRLLYYGIAAIIIFIIELLIGMYVNDNFIRPYMGDVLVVALIYCAIMAVTNYRVIPVAIFTLLFSYVIEFAQYYQLVNILGLENYTIAKIVIGTSFSWWDILCYTVGIIVVLMVEWYRNEW